MYRAGLLSAPTVSTMVVAGSASLEGLLSLSHGAFASSPLRHLFHLLPEQALDLGFYTKMLDTQDLGRQVA